MITGPTILITVVLVVLILVLPRKYMLTPFILAACFVPAEQHAALFGLHFYVLRILIVAGVLRIILRDEYRPLKWNRLDRLLFAWAIAGAIVYVVRRLDMQSVIYNSGVLMDMVGIYWIGRQGIRSWDDLKGVVRTFALCMLALAPFVAIESSTGTNPFMVLGRVYTVVREGEFRCQASFPHSIIFGDFVASLVPMFIALALTDRHKALYWAAVAASIPMILATNSSTPVGGLAAMLFFLALYRYRAYGAYFAIGFFSSLAALHIVMKQPVWHLLCRIRIIGGSTGYHRYLLIDAWVRNFSDWWLLGTDSTVQWGRGLFDITNQYVFESVRGGLLTFVLFVALLFVAIRTTGYFSRRRIGRDQQWLSWAVCVSLIGHCIMFIGVSCFGQIQMLLYLTFAFAGFIYEQNMLAAVVRQPRHAGAPKAGYAAGRRLAAAYRT